MSRRLPLFPLGTVLFPGASLPLRIFEDRYKEMLRYCLDNDRRFGVVLIREGVEAGGEATPFEVGTVARISQLGAPSRGSLPITVVGEQRFRIAKLDRSMSYLSGEIEVLEEDDGSSVDKAILDQAVSEAQRFLSTMLAAQGAWHSAMRIPEDALVLSYFIGILASSAPERSRQRLLAADDTAARLQAGIALLEEETRRYEASIMRAGPGRDESRFSTN